jgi:hypothetical protein
MGEDAISISIRLSFLRRVPEKYGALGRTVLNSDQNSLFRGRCDWPD